LDLWTTAKPFLETWMQEQVGWRGLLDRLRQEAPQYAQMLPDLPRLVHRSLQVDSRAEHPLLRELLAEQRRTNRLLQSLLLGVLGFMAGAVAAALWLAF
jgi:ubiquinone biosynthesis protein